MNEEPSTRGEGGSETDEQVRITLADNWDPRSTKHPELDENRSQTSALQPSP